MPASSDYYDDSDGASQSQPDGGDDKSKDDSSEQTALLPKAIFGGDVKPGDYIRLCVDKVDENDVIVHRDEGSGKDEKTEEEPLAEAPESPAASGGGMQSMMSDD